MTAKTLVAVAVLIATMAIPVASQTLTVSVTGGGKITGTGIDCPSDCSENLPALPTRIGLGPSRPPPSATVVLTATPNVGGSFQEWGGSCAGTSGPSCTVTIPAGGEATVSAAFVLARAVLNLPNRLVVSVVGEGGTITSEPAGINCPDDCDALASATPSSPGELFMLLGAQARPGYQFVGWSGDCYGDPSNRDPCRVTMTANRSVTGTFRAGVGISMIVVSAVAGVAPVGRVTSAPAGIDCTSTCSFYEFMGPVILTATPGPDWEFNRWVFLEGPASGTCGSSDRPICAVDMTEYRVIQAEFVPARLRLTVGVAFTEGGRVTSSPAGISCPETCTVTIPLGANELVLTATPAFPYVFRGWLGNCSGESPTCVLKASPHRQEVVAVFLRQ
jgi:uncharacterized repeat protein (TIGR02543 family)